MGYKIKIQELQQFSTKALRAAGLNETNSKIVSEALVTTDMFGVISHGTKNLLNYILKIQAGGLNPHAEPTVEAEGPAWAVIDGHAGMGMVSSVRAMNLAVAKA